MMRSIVNEHLSLFATCPNRTDCTTQPLCTFFLRLQVGKERKKKRTPIKSVHRCPYCHTVFYERGPLFKHLSKTHYDRVRNEEEGTLSTGKRVHHLQRSGVRLIDKWRVRYHLRKLNWDLNKERQAQLYSTARDILMEGLVMVGKETDPPETLYMQAKKAMAKLR